MFRREAQPREGAINPAVARSTVRLLDHVPVIAGNVARRKVRDCAETWPWRSPKLSVETSPRFLFSPSETGSKKCGRWSFVRCELSFFRSPTRCPDQHIGNKRDEPGSSTCHLFRSGLSDPETALLKLHSRSSFVLVTDPGDKRERHLVTRAATRFRERAPSR